VSISSSLRQKVRQKADFLCEYCEVSETDSGGKLLKKQQILHEEQHRLITCSKNKAYSGFLSRSIKPLDQ
jgi:hypothetical protein